MGVQKHYYLDAMRTFERVPKGVLKHDPAISFSDLDEAAYVAAVASVARTTLTGTTPLDMDDVNNARSLAVLSVPPQSRVVDIGSGSGVARALAARGCRVWEIDLDSTSASMAAPWCDGVLVGDIETADLDAFLGSQHADAILFLDVLEHLPDPAAAIRRVLPFLAPGGKVILAARHVGHAAVRLQLLAGAFPRTSEGLLNRPHLHYFDRTSLEELFRNAGLRVIDEARIVRSMEETEIPLSLAAFPREAIDVATAGPDADTYQFVFTLAPDDSRTDGERMPTLIRTLTDHLHHAERNCRRLQERARALEEAREGDRRSTEDMAALREELRRSELERRHSEEQLARTTDELVRCQLERRFLRDDVLLKDAYLATLREQVTQLQRSHANISIVVERLDNLTTEHSAEVQRAAELALSNREIRQQLERAQQELHRVHTAVADTLAQPRYVVADRCNAWAKKAGFLHAALKRIWTARRRGR
jgi:2-polyprenyl-3-methyl-5-hydroxy-6-metoxy-1,4-benzoquinol methylase